MAAWRYEISLVVLKKKNFNNFSTLEEKFRISARPCNILYFIQNNSPFLIGSNPPANSS